MAVNSPQIVIKGIEKVIKRDLEKHQGLLGQAKINLFSFKSALTHEIKRKKHYKNLIGGGKFNDDALRKSMDGIAVNIQHLSNKAKLSQDEIEHHTLIVDTLTKQLEDQMESLKLLRTPDEVYKPRD